MSDLGGSDGLRDDEYTPSMKRIRLEYMAMSDELRDELAAIMRKHYLEADEMEYCVCGGWGDDQMGEDWDEHLADVIVSKVALWVTCAKAEAENKAKEVTANHAKWLASKYGVGAVEARVAEAKAEALRGAADDWTQGAWANTPRHADRITDRMKAAQYAGDWLRARALAVGQEGESHE